MNNTNVKLPINLFVPTYEVNDCLNEIKECLEIGWTGNGYKTNHFEKAWIEYTGLKNAFFVNSATAGLILAFDILKSVNDWPENSEVITTPFTFVSSNHSILLNGLKPIFADIDDSLCLDPKEVVSKITKDTKAILYVGIGGNAANLEEITKIANMHNLKLVIDAAHMAGTKLKGETPGIDADAVIYSFHAVKNLPTADSGMVCFKELENDLIARKKAWVGISSDTFNRAQDGKYKWKYDVEFIGQKYHGNSIMAAIALVQLKSLDKDNRTRKKLVNRYQENLSSLSEIKFVNIPNDVESSNHLFQIIVEKRNELLAYLNSKQIYPGVHYVPNDNYRMYHTNLSYSRSQFFGDHVLSLPLHLRLSFNDVDYICMHIKQFLLEK